MEEVMQIKSTKDFSVFKKLLGNRNINISHVNSLVESMKKENLLPMRPILVNGAMEVIDGQHRLEAAKALDLEIFYLVVSKSGAAQVAKINSNQKNWTNKDYLNLHIEAFSSQEYIKLNSFMLKYDFDLNTAFAFLDYPIKKNDKREEFQQGNFVFPTNEDEIIGILSKYTSTINLLKHHDVKPSGAFASLVFINAFLRFAKSKKISWEVFWKKLEMNWIKAGKRYNTDQYLEMLLEIYNCNSPYRVLINELF